MNSIYSFSNSKNFFPQLKNSSSSIKNSALSTRTIIKQRRLKSEQLCHSSKTIRSIRPDTDPLHYRKALFGNGINYSYRRDHLFNMPNISTISFYDDK